MMKVRERSAAVSGVQNIKWSGEWEIVGTGIER